MSLIVFFAAAHAVSVIAFFITTRYRLPMIPIYALGTGWLLVWMFHLLREGRWKQPAVAAATGAVLLLALNLNLFEHGDSPTHGHYLLGLAHHNAGRLEAAVNEYDRAVEFGGPYAYEALFVKGMALQTLGRGGAAYDALRQSLQLVPGNFEALDEFLRMGLRTGREAETRQIALDLCGPTLGSSAAFHFLLGTFGTETKRYAEAETDLRNALALDPGHLGAKISLATLLGLVGRTDESFQEFLEAERIHPTHPTVQLSLAKHYVLRGDRESALRHLRIAEQYGGNADAFLQKALELPPG
jgi:tetratricopeptide (TPR) repeat protein